MKFNRDKYLFDIGFKKIFIKAVVENIGSNRVIEKCGFKFTHQEHLEHQSSFELRKFSLMALDDDKFQAFP